VSKWQDVLQQCLWADAAAAAGCKIAQWLQAPVLATLIVPPCLLQTSMAALPVVRLAAAVANWQSAIVCAMVG
jgi:hypothetical protein